METLWVSQRHLTELEYFSLLWTLTPHENPTHTIQVLMCMFYVVNGCIGVMYGWEKYQFGKKFTTGHSVPPSENGK